MHPERVAEIAQVLAGALRGCPTAIERVTALAFAGVSQARALRENPPLAANESGARRSEGGAVVTVAIEVVSCGEWHRSRFGVFSPSAAAAMIANLRERGIQARSVRS